MNCQYFYNECEQKAFVEKKIPKKTCELKRAQFNICLMVAAKTIVNEVIERIDYGNETAVSAQMELPKKYYQKFAHEQIMEFKMYILV